jgi:hypothetical protein
MKILKTTIGITLFGIHFLNAEVITISRYDELINYHKNANMSLVEGVKIGGIYASYGNLNYLLEADFSHTHVDFKKNFISDFTQDDYSFLASRYYPMFMYRVGIHSIKTDDVDLGDATIFIASLQKYQTQEKSKLTYGTDFYLSHYKKGYNKKGELGKIDIYQFSPFVSYFKIINSNTTNSVKMTLTDINTNAYKQQNYFSYALEDAVTYQKITTKIKGYKGEKKSSIEDDGRTVYNTKDLMKYGYGAQLSYALTSNFSINLSYDIHHFEIPDLYTFNQEKQNNAISVTNSVTIGSISYSY